MTGLPLRETVKVSRCEREKCTKAQQKLQSNYNARAMGILRMSRDNIDDDLNDDHDDNNFDQSNNHRCPSVTCLGCGRERAWSITLGDKL